MRPIVSKPKDLGRAPVIVEASMPPTQAEQAERRKRLHWSGLYAAAGLLAGARALYLLENGEIFAWLLVSFALTTWAYLTWRIG